MMFPSVVLLFVASALFSTSNGADFPVQVGQGGLVFVPDHVTGAVAGDTITFQFLPSGHTATQGTLATPCVSLAGGFDSGTRAGAATADAANTFKVTVNNTDSIWVYCKTPGHCPAGMVFAVNPANDAQLTQFQQNAGKPVTSSSASTGATTGGTTATSSGTAGATSASSTTRSGAGLSVAEVVPAVLMTVLAGSFGALLM